MLSRCDFKSVGAILMKLKLGEDLDTGIIEVETLMAGTIDGNYRVNFIIKNTL
jgi:hypothetical protein